MPPEPLLKIPVSFSRRARRQAEAYLVYNDKLISNLAILGDPAAAQIAQLYVRWKNYPNAGRRMLLLRAVDEWKKGRMN